MIDQPKGFVECTACNLWGYIPLHFKETKHFAQCPACKGPMHLMRTDLPYEVGLRTEEKIIAGFMPKCSVEIVYESHEIKGAE